MAFERVVCEVVYKIIVHEVYSEYRSVTDYHDLNFECKPDAERHLAAEGYTRTDHGDWKKSYRQAYITRNLREVKE